MTKAKIAITVAPAVVRRARAAVRHGKARSVSSYFEQAAQKYGEDDDLIAFLDQILEETGGPPTREEIRASDERLKGVLPRKQRRRK